MAKYDLVNFEKSLILFFFFFFKYSMLTFYYVVNDCLLTFAPACIKELIVKTEN